MNRMKIGMYYVKVCACGQALNWIQVTRDNSREVAKFKENAARCGFDTEHVTVDYIGTHQECTCEDAEVAS